MDWTIEYLKGLRESEDSVEFKAAEYGNFAYDGGTKTAPKDRRVYLGMLLLCVMKVVVHLCLECMTNTLIKFWGHHKISML